MLGRFNLSPGLSPKRGEAPMLGRLTYPQSFTEAGRRAHNSSVCDSSFIRRPPSSVLRPLHYPVLYVILVTDTTTVVVSN